MAIPISGTLEPAGKFPLVDAHSVSVTDKQRLDEYLEDLSVSYPIETSGTELQPETYYAFGEVDSLSVTLVDPNDGKVHEYCFEFKPTTEKFTLTVSPNVTWAGEPQYRAGKTCQVSILRGIGVMVCA